MATVIGTDLTIIAQAVEQELLTAAVAGDISNIYWIEQGEEPPPGQTGQRDILLAQRPDETAGTSIVGAGRFTEVYAGLDVYLRSTLALDRRSTRRDWFIAHRALINGVMNALMGFFPEDAASNALTIEGFILDRNAAPVRDRSAETWGYTVGTYRFHYVPSIDHTVIG